MSSSRKLLKTTDFQARSRLFHKFYSLNRTNNIYLALYRSFFPRKAQPCYGVISHWLYLFCVYSYIAWPYSWEAAQGSSETITVPDNWKSGRIWGRRNCNFGANPGPTSCASGGCNGGLQCTNPVLSILELHTRFIAKTMFREFLPLVLLNGPYRGMVTKTSMTVLLTWLLLPLLVYWQNTTSLVSLVDGFNIPMSITNNKGCDLADCPADLNNGCEYRYILDWLYI